MGLYNDNNCIIRCGIPSLKSDEEISTFVNNILLTMKESKDTMPNTYFKHIELVSNSPELDKLVLKKFYTSPHYDREYSMKIFEGLSGYHPKELIYDLNI